MSIELVTEKWEKPVEPNPFEPVVAQLSEMGDDYLGKFVVPEGMKASKAKVLFASAARAQGFSARLKIDEVDGKGRAILGYVLGPKRKARGSGKAADAGSVEGEATESAVKG